MAASAERVASVLGGRPTPAVLGWATMGERQFLPVDPAPCDHGAMQGDLAVTGDPNADQLLNDDPNALLIGMLLDQQIPLEWAFLGPATLRDRLGHIDPIRIAMMDVDEIVEVACRTPAIHRFPAVMARRLHALCDVLVRDHGGRAELLWTDGPEGAVLHRRLLALPGFGDEKAKIFIALLAKRQGVAVPGWEAAAGVFADQHPRSIADTHDAASLAAVRAWKAAQKAAGKDKQDRPLLRPDVTPGSVASPGTTTPPVPRRRRR